MAATVTYSLQTIENEFAANTFTVGDQYGAEITGLSNGGFAVVYGNDAANDFPLVSLYDSDFNAVGTWHIPYDEPPIPDLVGDPEIIELANGNIAVVWDSGPAGSDDVLGAILDPDTGAVIHSQFIVSLFGGDADPEAVALANGNWVVAMSGGSGVFLQVMSPTGAQIGTQIVINPAGTQFDPAIAALAGGDFVVTWTDSNAGNDQIYAQVHNADGSVRIAAFLVGGSGENNQSAVAGLPNGSFAVVYSDTGWATGDGISMQIFSAAGAAESIVIRVDADLAKIERDPDITVLANGFIVVSWTHPFAAGDNDIYARVFDADGNIAAINGSTNPIIINGSPNDETDASIAAFFSGVFGTVSQDETVDGLGDGIAGEVSEIVRTTTGDGTDENLIGDELRDLISGNDGNDNLEGMGGDDSLFGGDGADVLVGGEGADALDGGAGWDQVSYGDSNGSVFVNLLAGTGSGGHAVGDTFSGVENLAGSSLDDVIVGSATTNVFWGSGGNDTLEGGEGDDTLNGEDGNDVLEGGGGDDELHGGDGIDTASYAGAGAFVGMSLMIAGPVFTWGAGMDTLTGIENLIGSAFNDQLTGNLDSNTLSGGDGDDVLYGLDDNDVLAGGEGADELVGDAGFDILIGGAGADILDGGADADLASFLGGNGVTVSLLAGIAKYGHAHGDTLISIENIGGSDFFDEITGDAGSNTLGGFDGNDVLNGSNGDDLLGGGEGNDLLFGGAGADVLGGGDGMDAVNYSNSDAAVKINLTTGSGSGGHAQGDMLDGIEIVTGSAFGDVLVGGAEAETLNGGQGNDSLYGTLGADRLNGNQGVDFVEYSGSVGVTVNLLSGVGSGAGSEAEGDLLTGIENLHGTSEADKLTGTTGDNSLAGMNGDDELNGSLGDDQLVGGKGNDVMVGGAGGDTLQGGEGVDWVYYSNSDGAVSVNLTSGAASGAHAAGDSFASVENLFGSAFGDILAGNSLDNTLNGFQGGDTLSGAGGADVLLGGTGDDWLNGGPGDDVLSGYTGADTFIYNLAAFGADAIVGFEDGTDLIDLNAGLTFADFTETAVGTGTLLTLDADPTNTILILGTPPADIDAGDFI